MHISMHLFLLLRYNDFPLPFRLLLAHSTRPGSYQLPPFFFPSCKSVNVDYSPPDLVQLGDLLLPADYRLSY